MGRRTRPHPEGAGLGAKDSPRCRVEKRGVRGARGGAPQEPGFDRRFVAQEAPGPTRQEQRETCRAPWRETLN